MQCLLGYVENEEMILSEMGEIVYKNWWEIQNKNPHVILDEFQVMPNHIHGIIIINSPYNYFKNKNYSNMDIDTPNMGVLNPPNRNWKPGAIGVMINHYKMACTIEIRKKYPFFGWHSRYHDHVICDKDELIRIRNYIRNNPRNWNEDQYRD